MMLKIIFYLLAKKIQHKIKIIKTNIKIIRTKNICTEIHTYFLLLYCWWNTCLSLNMQTNIQPEYFSRLQAFFKRLSVLTSASLCLSCPGCFLAKSLMTSGVLKAWLMAAWIAWSEKESETNKSTIFTNKFRNEDCLQIKENHHDKSRDVLFRLVFKNELTSVIARTFWVLVGKVLAKWNTFQLNLYNCTLLPLESWVLTV